MSIWVSASIGVILSSYCCSTVSLFCLCQCLTVLYVCSVCVVAVHLDFIHHPSICLYFFVPMVVCLPGRFRQFLHLAVTSVGLLTHLQGVVFTSLIVPLYCCLSVSMFRWTSVSGHRQLFRCRARFASLSFNDGSHPSTLPPPNFT